MERRMDGRLQKGEVEGREVVRCKEGEMWALGRRCSRNGVVKQLVRKRER